MEEVDKSLCLRWYERGPGKGIDLSSVADQPRVQVRKDQMGL